MKCTVSTCRVRPSHALKEPESLTSKAEQFAKEVEAENINPESSNEAGTLLSQYQELQKKVHTEST